jgi:hypothetical protein
MSFLSLMMSNSLTPVNVFHSLSREVGVSE